MKYVYGPDGQKQYNEIGEPIPRPYNSPLECHCCPKIPPGRPKTRFQAVELGPREQAAWGHFKRCDAVRDFPKNDEAVEAVAAVAREAEDDSRMVLQTSRQWQGMETLLGTLAVVSGVRNGRG